MIGKSALCGCLFLGTAMAGVGQGTSENMAKCNSPDPDTRITACTAIIQSRVLTALLTTESISSAYNHRGTAYNSKGDHDRAIQDFTEAIHLSPNHAYNYRNRGIDFSEKGDYDRAIQDFSEVIRLNPDDTISSASNDPSAYVLRGYAYSKRGDYRRALQDLNEAIHLHPNHARAYYERGVVYSDEENYDRAIEDYDHAIRLSPNDIFAYLGRGRAYFCKGDYDDAIRNYSEAIRLNQNFATAYENRGTAYFIQHNLTAAAVDYAHAISVAPSSNSAIFAALSLHVVLKQQGRDDGREFARVVAAADLSKWPGLVLKLELGQTTADEVIKAAAIPSGMEKWRVCEANFFAGEDALLHHQRAIALTRLKAARDGCPKGANDYALALAELKRLSAIAPAK